MYVYRFNQRTGKSQLVGDVQAGNPSFLVMNHDANRVYAVSEYDDGRQGLGAFVLNKKEGSMTPLGYQVRNEGYSTGKQDAGCGTMQCDAVWWICGDIQL